MRRWLIALTGIELDANSFLSHRLAGLSYIGLNRNEEAIETFRKPGKNFRQASAFHHGTYVGILQ